MKSGALEIPNDCARPPGLRPIEPGNRPGKHVREHGRRYGPVVGSPFCGARLRGGSLNGRTDCDGVRAVLSSSDRSNGVCSNVPASRDARRCRASEQNGRASADRRHGDCRQRDASQTDRTGIAKTNRLCVNHSHRFFPLDSGSNFVHAELTSHPAPQPVSAK